jgi:hypothetical protein
MAAQARKINTRKIDLTVVERRALEGVRDEVQALEVEAANLAARRSAAQKDHNAILERVFQDHKEPFPTSGDVALRLRQESDGRMVLEWDALGEAPAPSAPAPAAAPSTPAPASEPPAAKARDGRRRK